MNEMKSPTFKNRFTSEFNPGVMEFERLEDMLKECDKISVNCSILKKELFLNYFSITKQIWYFLRPYVLLSYKTPAMKKMDNKCDNLWEEVIKYHNQVMSNPKTSYDIALLKRIDLFHNNCMLIKQLIGFGVPLTKEESVKTTVRKYLGVRGINARTKVAGT